MKIRSITYFCNPKYPLEEQILQQAGTFLAKAKSAYEAAGYEVQTTRLATIPFPRLFRSNDFSRAKAVEIAVTLSERLPQIGVEYASLGPALAEFPESYEEIPQAIASSQNIFFGGEMASKEKGISLPAVKACAEVIVRCATIQPNGFANLQFAALANVDAGTPFFPAAYHDRDEPSFAIATESADLAVQAFENAKTLEDGRKTLISQVTQHGQAISRIAQGLTQSPVSNSPMTNHHLPTFNGIDFSLAPFPTEAQSLGTAFDKLGVPQIGYHGSLAAAAILTEAIDRADFRRTGFSGLMMPVLEDAALGRSAADGTLTVKDVLLYSAVCGTGLDTIPLPGDTTAEQLVPLLLDLCALALRLDKPLTARLMPIPGKKAGDEANFDFAFFAPSQVMALESAALSSLLNGQEILQITKRG